jgi:L-fuculose-phosphate aldolase
MKEKELRNLVKESGVRLVKEGLVRGTWGNVSVRFDEKSMIVTPSGLDYMSLTPEDMVLVDINTLEYAG